ncbi:MAG: carboxypeptidase regulatory-like domain-containing protein [Planctomycetes bacterium]|nr:carboxypeptidase regulatory-like domain-containing protein [Planctomycetota bacterium]
MSHASKIALGVLCLVAAGTALAFLLLSPVPGSRDAQLDTPAIHTAPLSLDESFEAVESGAVTDSTQRRTVSEGAGMPTETTDPGAGPDGVFVDPGWSSGWVTLSGRFVDAQEKPVRNVPLFLRGRFLTGDAKDRYDDLINWRSKRGRSDGKGKWTFRVRVSPYYHLTLQTKSDEHVNQSWDFKDLKPGDVRDLGDVRLLRGGTIVGEVRREDGSLIVDGWKLRASHADRSVAKEINKQPSRREPGTFRLENLQEGPWRLSLRMEGGLPDEGHFIAEPAGEIEVKEGETATVLYRYHGPALKTRLSVQLDVGRIKHVHPKANLVTLTGPGGVYTAGSADDEIWSHTFEDIAAGSYTLRVDDPRFRPVVAEGLETGTKDHKVDVRGNATLTLLVRDSGTRKPIERYNVKMREWKAPEPEDPNDPTSRMRRTFGSWTQNVKRTADFPGGKLVLDDIAAGSYVVMVDADGRSRTEVDVLGLAPNEERTVHVDMLPGGTIQGVVYDADGKTPREGVKVAIQPASESGGDERWARMGGFVRTMRGDTGFQQVDSDARGRFAFEGLTPGAYAIRAQYEPPQEGLLGLMTSFSSGGSGLSVEGETLTVNHGQVIDDLELVLPPTAVIRGRVLGPVGANFADLQLSFESVEGAARDVRVVTKLDQEGRFAVGPVYPTTLKATLLFFDEESPFETFREGMARKELGQVIASVDSQEEVVLDARPYWPSKLRLVVESFAGPIAEARVSLADVETPSESAGPRFFQNQRSETDREGVATFPTVMAGPKDITVTGPDGKWTYKLPTPIQIAPSTELERTIRIALHQGRVRFVDATTGAPLATSTVYVNRIEDGQEVEPVGVFGGRGRRGRAPRAFTFGGGGGTYRTDESGSVELELPEGTYLARLDQRGGDGLPVVAEATEETSENHQLVEPRFTWGSGGAVPATLRIGWEPKEKDK